ncbi:MAG: hypothetical protein ABW352_10695 [Polyangiales bacterium]
MAHEPPHGIHLLWSASDAAPVIVTNRGIVFPNEGGASEFSLRCNEAYGALASARPEALLDDQGAVVLATLQDITRTSDQACSFSRATGLPTDDPNLSLGGFAVDPSVPGRALASTQAYKSQAQLFVSDDYARSWRVLAANNPLAVYKTLLIASDGQHVIAGGQRYDMANNKLLSIYGYSLDGGQTWTDSDVASTREPLGYAPNDSNVVFMREALPNSTLDPRDRLLRSSDGGKTFTQVGEFATLSGFAADGNTVWLGSRFGGLFQSDDAGLTFTRILPELINGADCVYFRQDVLWACANIAPNTDGIFTSQDRGKSFTQFMRFEEVTTQVQCADVEVCELPWRDWEYELTNGWSSTDGGLPSFVDASVPSDEPTGQVRVDAGAADAGLAVIDAAPEPVAKSDDGCSLGGHAEGGLFAIALAALLRRRRR